MVWAASTVIALGSAAVGAYGAYSSSKAAGNAADAQTHAADQANQTQMAQYNQTRADNAPYRQAGGAALTQLQRGLGLASPGNTDHSESNFDAAKFMPYAPDAQRYMDANGVSAYDYYKADGSKAPGDFWKQTDPGVNASDPGFGALSKNFGASDFQTDPGYQFRMQQGQDALDNSAASRGGLLSGAQLKATSQYNQNFASNEYSNAYNRFNTNKMNNFNQLSGVAGTGQVANNLVGQLGQQTANNISNNQTSAGAARSSGYIAQGNALNSGLSQGVNALGQYNAMNQGSSPNSMNYWGGPQGVQQGYQGYGAGRDLSGYNAPAAGGWGIE